MLLFRKLLTIGLLSLLLAHCGFKPEATALHYPFKSIQITSDNTPWQRQVSRKLEASQVRITKTSPYTLALTTPTLTHSNLSLNIEHTSQTITYTLSTNATFYNTKKRPLTKTFSTQLSQYSQSSQILAPQPDSSFKQQLQNNLLTEIAYWLASSHFKKALQDTHAN